MAAMDNQLVRVHRDIEADKRELQAINAKITSTRRAILELDEATAATNEHRRLYPADQFDIHAALERDHRRERLYFDLRRARQRIDELQRYPYRSLTLQEYLEAYHSVHLALPARDILDPPSEVRTHDDLQRRVYPLHIELSTDFAAKQLGVWRQVAQSHNFGTEEWYPCLYEIEWTQNSVDGSIVGCQHSLFRFMQTAVYEAVDTIMDHITEDESLIEELGLEDCIWMCDNDVPHLDVLRSGINRGMATFSADRRLPGGFVERVHVLVSCYRPPSRLSINEILDGLQGGIDTLSDIIWAQFASTFKDMSKFLVTAVIVQLFDRMLQVGTRFGYITTGEAFVFLEIAEDKWTLRYAVCVPHRDVEFDSVTGLHRTAVAQVLAFTLRALQAEQKPREWYDEVLQSRLWWLMNPDDIFNKIPPMVRKMRRNITYAPFRWRPFLQMSPIQQRVPHMVWPGFKPRDNEADFNDFGVFKFLSIHRMDLAGLHIDQWPFCTPECLARFSRIVGGLDEACPNFRHHGDRYISREELLDRLKTQLDMDMAAGNTANYMLLGRAGSYTALFKVRLASHGYTLLMKGVMRSRVDRLRREADIYGHMMGLQGLWVPVCFGIIRAQNPMMIYLGSYVEFMVFGGLPVGVMPLSRCLTAGVDRREIRRAVAVTFKQIHSQRVLHLDPEPRNMLYDASGKRAIVADFDRAVHDVFEGQEYLYGMQMRDGAHEWRPARERISNAWFAAAGRYVRQRVVEFCRRGIRRCCFGVLVI